MDDKCLFPGCVNGPSTRGLCGLHYQYARRLVTRGKTTWTKLEEGGKAKAPTRHHKFVSAWFLGEPHEQRIMEDVDAEQQGKGSQEEPKKA